jgi:N6-adenosine-specific RNA methylase IME4
MPRRYGRRSKLKFVPKPEEFRKMIDDLYQTGSRIELFARQPAPGWATQGNEAETVAI